jgi:excisionase family DNA binding protein
MSLQVVTVGLSVADVAERCKVKPTSVFRWIESGKIKAVKVLPGGAFAIDADSLAKFLETRRARQ